jgi:hypothetical protein
MDRGQRFAVLRECLSERGWFCSASGWCVHPLLGRYGVLSALTLNGEADAVLAMSEMGLVYSVLWDDEPRSAQC